MLAVWNQVNFKIFENKISQFIIFPMNFQLHKEFNTQLLRVYCVAGASALVYFHSIIAITSGSCHNITLFLTTNDGQKKHMHIFKNEKHLRGKYKFIVVLFTSTFHKGEKSDPPNFLNMKIVFIGKIGANKNAIKINAFAAKRDLIFINSRHFFHTNYFISELDEL